MTRRERLERKVERRHEWAEGRASKASALRKQDEHYRGDIAFNTQPGHIPERARVIARSDRAIEHQKMAAHHEAKAAGLAEQLDRSIFSDDANAIEALEARIAEREAVRDRCKAVNAAIRKTRKAFPLSSEPGILAQMVREGTITQGEAEQLARSYSIQPYHGLGFPTYHMTNLGANIRRDRERIEQIKRQAAAQAEAEAAPGGLVITRHPEYDYCSIRFAEKPERAILDSLKTAGFCWGAGTWSGKTSAIPDCVTSMEGGA